MLSYFNTIWTLMRGYRLRYGLALVSLLAATLLNYGVPLIGSVTIDFAVTGHEIASDTSRPVLWILQLLGGVENLRSNLWLVPVSMVLLSVIGGAFTYLKGWQASLASDGIAR